tara:strand:+ start:34501 stop:34839 length:339 start_codon:yes stop_codon:yes gene_type:complete
MSDKKWTDEEIFFREILEVMDYWFLDRDFTKLRDLLIKYVPPSALAELVDTDVQVSAVKKFAKMKSFPKGYEDKFTPDYVEEHYPRDIKIMRRDSSGNYQDRTHRSKKEYED